MTQKNKQKNQYGHQQQLSPLRQRFWKKK